MKFLILFAILACTLSVQARRSSSSEEDAGMETCAGSCVSTYGCEDCLECVQGSTAGNVEANCLTGSAPRCAAQCLLCGCYCCTKNAGGLGSFKAPCNTIRRQCPSSHPRKS